MHQSPPRHRKVAILTGEGFQKLQTAISQTKIWSHYTKSCTLEALSEETGLSTHTLSKVHTREAAVDLRTLVRYFRAFNLTLETRDYISPIGEPETLEPVLASPPPGVPVTQSLSLNPAMSWDMALEDDLREEYDLSQLKNPVRGKHYQQYREGHRVTIHYEDGTKKIEHFPPQNDVIILDPDVKKYFPNSESVNATLRSLIQLIPQQ